jgi:hypothetical protein
MLSLHLPELGRHKHVVVTNDRTRDGEIGARRVEKLLPETITLCARGTPGDTRGGLPDTIERSPEVVAAKAKGLLEVILSAPPAAAAVPTPEPAPARAAQES